MQGSNLIQPEDGDTRHIPVRDSTEVVTQADGWRTDLSSAGPAQQLCVDFIRHAQAGCAHRMTEALEAAIGLARNGTITVITAIQNVGRCAPGSGQSEVFHHDEFCDGKTVMDFNQI